MMWNQAIMRTVAVVSSLTIASLGCRQAKPAADPMLESFQLLRDSFRSHADVQQRIELAAAKWHNGFPDPNPILIHAALVESSDGVLLALVTFDEDADVLGFITEEERNDPNGSTSLLSEMYPVFAHVDPRGITQLKAFPAHLRDRHQRKPEEDWRMYVSTPVQQLREEYMRRSEEGDSFWRDTLPPVWVSVPESDMVHVRLRAYDEVGHISEAVSLFHERRKAGQEPDD